LCNTFFSTDQMPRGIRQFVACLPLSQTSGMIRGISAGEYVGFRGIIVLLIYLAAFSLISVIFIYKKKTL